MSKSTTPTAEGTRTADEPKTVAELKKEEPIRRELAKVTGRPLPVVKLRHGAEHRRRLYAYVGAAVLLGVLLYLLQLGTFAFLGAELARDVARIARAAFLAAIVLAASKLAGIYLLGRIEDRVSRFNFERVRGLVTGVAVAAIVISAVFVGWRGTVMQLGLVSLVMGFALQSPITSFLGWVYILVRQPYRVGDRVQVGEAKGDVIDVSYLDTTLWECGGPFLSSDHPSGRVIRIPNKKVLDSTVFNYSWPLFPYIWNEVVVQVGYNADLEFVARTMREAAEEEMGPEMVERVETYKALLARTPVDEVQVKEEPVVLFRASSNTWIEASVRYLVLPKRAGGVRSRLLKRIVGRLNASPEKAMLPKADLR